MCLTKDNNTMLRNPIIPHNVAMFNTPPMYVCMYGIHVTGATRVLYNYYEVLVVQYLAS